MVWSLGQKQSVQPVNLTGSARLLLVVYHIVRLQLFPSFDPGSLASLVLVLVGTSAGERPSFTEAKFFLTRLSAVCPSSPTW